MRRFGLFSVLLSIILLIPAAVVADTPSSGIEEPSDDADGNDALIGPTVYPRDHDFEDTGNEIYFDDLAERGVYRKMIISPDEMNFEPYFFGNSGSTPTRSYGDYEKDENDGLNNATEIFDGDEVYNNVSSYFSQDGQGNTVVNFHDLDWFYINLTADPQNSTTDRLQITVNSTEATNKSAYLNTRIGTFFLGGLLGSNAPFDVMDFELTGGNQSSTSVIDIEVEASGAYYMRFLTWNETMLNYSFEVSVSQVTRTEWNGVFNPYGGTALDNSTKDVKMASVDQANDTYDWYNLNPYLVDKGLDVERGDKTKLSMQFDVASEFWGLQSGYKGSSLYGVKFPSVPITNLYFLYYDYANDSYAFYLPDGQHLPFASQVFGNPNDPVTLGFSNPQSIGGAWLGVNSMQIWFIANQQGVQYVDQDGCDHGAKVSYNLTRWKGEVFMPNDPPQLTGNIPDLTFNEDEGPWEEALELSNYFTDAESPEWLRYEIESVGTVSSKLDVWIENESVMVDSDENWHGSGTYEVTAIDNGSSLNPNNHEEDARTRSNEFEIIIMPVNDEAYIERVDTVGSQVVNDHTPILIPAIQGNPILGKKIYGADNDTEDEDTLTYTHNATTPGFSINDLGQFNFIPSNDDVGVNWIKVWVDDGNGDDKDDYCILKFEVTNKNDPPTLSTVEWKDGNKQFDLTEDDSIVFRGAQEDMEFNLTVVAMDPDLEIGLNESLRWIVGDPAWDVMPHPTEPNRAYLVYYPTNQDAVIGETETTFYCIDSQNVESDEISVRVTVENRNDRPEILYVNDVPVNDGMVNLTEENGKNGLEDQPFTITVLANDIDPRDSLTFTYSTPELLTLTQIPDVLNDYKMNFTYTPTQEDVGMHTVLITAMDEDNVKAEVTVRFEIKNVNDPPEKPILKIAEDAIFKQGNEIEFWVEDFSDPDGDNLTFLWEFGDGNTAEGESVTHVYESIGNMNVVVTVKDGNGGEAKRKRSISIIKKDEEQVDPDLDSDGDGMPDVWENKYSKLDKDDPNDADFDSDGDGFTNYEEYLGADGEPPNGTVDDSTNPIDVNDHPPKQAEGGEDGSSAWIIIVIVVIIFLVIIAVLLFFLTRKPKKVAQQQMYGTEDQRQLPPQQQQAMPGVQEGKLEQGEKPAGLPAAGAQGDQEPPEPEKEEEEDLLDSFMGEAKKELEDSKDQGQEDDVWRPPAAEETGEHESQVDDLFDEEEQQQPPEEEEPVEEEAAEEEDSEEDEMPSPPKPPKLPDLPPPPPKN